MPLDRSEDQVGGFLKLWNQCLKFKLSFEHSNSLLSSFDLTNLETEVDEIEV